LPQARDAGFDLEYAAPVPKVISFELIRKRRTWPD
jgi:hypothetical protein